MAATGLGLATATTAGLGDGADAGEGAVAGDDTGLAATVDGLASADGAGAVVAAAGLVAAGAVVGELAAGAQPVRPTSTVSKRAKTVWNGRGIADSPINVATYGIRGNILAE
jgi:hypothetical protein